jgi:hypothetical protein
MEPTNNELNYTGGTLIVVSNHDPKHWSEAQKKGWKEIIYLPFPNVAPWATSNNVRDMAKQLIEEIRVVSLRAEKCENVYVNCQGEFSLATEINCELHCFYLLAFPTTERKSVDTVLLDGTTKKDVTFEFVQWRIM